MTATESVSPRNSPMVTAYRGASGLSIGHQGASNIEGEEVLCLLQREPESRSRSTFMRMKANIRAIRAVSPNASVVCLAKEKGANASGIKYLNAGLPWFGDLGKGFLGTVTEVFGKNLFKGIRRAAKEIRKANTVVYLEAYGNLPYLLMARLQHKRAICDFQNCETELGLSIAQNGTIGSRIIGAAWMVYGWVAEELFLRLCDVVVVPSAHDRSNLRKFHRRFRADIKVIPNVLPTPPGVSIPDRRTDGEMNVVFISSADYRPNWDACLFICNEIAPRLTHLDKMHFILAGARTEKLRPRTSNVQVLGYVNDLDGLLKKAQVGLSPVFSGAGTSYKVLLYYCAGLVVVGSGRSMRGIDPRLTGGVRQANTADEFAALLEEFYRDPDRLWKGSGERSALARELYTVSPSFVRNWRSALGEGQHLTSTLLQPIPSAK
jgi:glycosyltransferase involved in cell wall biosynthesis